MDTGLKCFLLRERERHRRVCTLVYFFLLLCGVQVAKTASLQLENVCGCFLADCVVLSCMNTVRAFPVCLNQRLQSGILSDSTVESGACFPRGHRLGRYLIFAAEGTCLLGLRDTSHLSSPGNSFQVAP